MKRLLAILLVICMLAVALASCSDNDKDSKRSKRDKDKDEVSSESTESDTTDDSSNENNNENNNNNSILSNITVMNSVNYEISSNMMSYYFATECNDFVSTYSAYLSNNGQAGMLSLDPNVSLKKQTFGGDPASGNTYYDTMFFGEFLGTWFDFFLYRVTDSVKSMLIYCEYARENNIALDESDRADIEETMQTFRDYVGSDKADSYFSQVIARGVKEKDVRKCLEYSMLANKAMLAFSDKISASVTDDEILERYEIYKNDYKEVYNTRTFSYAYFISEKDAETAIAAMMEHASFKNGALSSETFRELALANGAEDFGRVTDGQKGEFEIRDFDDWLFGDDVTPGAITETPINYSRGGCYIVALYEQLGVENWKADIKSVLVAEKSYVEHENLIARYSITVNEKKLKNIKYVGFDN